MFATFDITAGYHQTAVAEESSELTAFICSSGLYEWVRTPFGLKGAPSYFMKKMAVEVLNGLLYNTVECYLDDAITWGETPDELLQNIEILLRRLNEKNIKLNPKKARIGLPSIEYTGHVLSEDGLTFSNKKIDKVINFKQPNTQKELRSFLGLTNYFRQHIQNYSMMVKPLLDAVKVYKPRQEVKWDDTRLNAFELVKAAINSCPQLYFLKDNLLLYLHTDASDYGAGAYLYQMEGDKELPIAFLSKTFTAEQKRWSVPDKECYAIIYAFKKFEHYIRDRFFILRTDHKNLTYVDLENSGKVRRWKLLMQQYNFNIEYIKGEDNIPADAFSRLMLRDGVPDSLCRDSWQPIPEGNAQLTGVKRGRGDDDEPIHVSSIKAIHTTIARQDQNVPPIVDADLNDDTTTPKKLSTKIYKLISKCHNSIIGHMGVEKTINKLHQLEEVKTLTEPWLYMRRDVRYFIKMCPCCQKIQPSNL